MSSGIYAGIGSRRAPADVLGLCTRIASTLAARGRVLRSGHAIGCDQAFEAGAGDRAEVFLPWRDYEGDVEVLGQVRLMPTVKAIEMVPGFHPAPERLSMASLRLMARNAHIILGPMLDEPVGLVICWTLDEERGGTSAGLRLARQRDIPVCNLAERAVRVHWEELCDRGTANAA